MLWTTVAISSRNSFAACLYTYSDSILPDSIISILDSNGLRPKLTGTFVQLQHFNYSHYIEEIVSILSMFIYVFPLWLYFTKRRIFGIITGIGC